MRTSRFYQFLLSGAIAVCLLGSEAAPPAESHNASPPQGVLWIVTLFNGDRILGQIEPPAKRDFELKTYFGDVTVLGAWVRSISVFKGALPAAHVCEGDKSQDTLHFRKGDVAKGRLKKIADGKLEFVAGQHTLHVEWDKIDAIVFREEKEPCKSGRHAEQFAFAQVRLRDGSIITGEILRLSRDAAKLSVPYFSQDARIPLSSIDSLSFVGQKHARRKEGYKMPEFSRPIPLENTFLPKDLGFIQGRVTTQGGKPLTGCFIFFYDVAAKRLYGEDNIFHMLTHSVGGRYASPPLKPGKYVVIAMDLSEQADGAVWAGLAPDVSVKAGEITTADLSMFWWYDMWPELKKEPLLVEAFQRAVRMVRERGDDWIKAHHDNLLDFEGW